jgi:hypothetical protein
VVASASDPTSAADRYDVTLRREDDGWTVAIVDVAGVEVSARRCGDEEEARTYASTVRQHASWLSEPAFRAYYLLDEPGGE